MYTIYSNIHNLRCSTQLWTYLSSSLYYASISWLCWLSLPLSSSTYFEAKISDRSFRNAAPQLWNHLPPSLRSYSSCNYISSIDLSFPQLAFSSLHFISGIKTHLFSLSYHLSFQHINFTLLLFDQSMTLPVASSSAGNIPVLQVLLALYKFLCLLTYLTSLRHDKQTLL